MCCFMRNFLPHQKSITELWTRVHIVNTEFLQPDTNSFVSHADFGVVPEKVLCKFINDKGNTFMAVSKLLTKFEPSDRPKGAL